MGGKGGRNKGPSATPGSQPRREESSGKKQGNVNAKTMCKLDHLKNLAVWTATEASLPSLGAFLGQRLAATTEALGLPAASAFVCERCESILQPGDSTVRIEKNKKSKIRHRHKKSNPTAQNNVVYRCHFCSHRNLMRGTPKGYVKGICPRKAKLPLKTKPAKFADVEERTALLAKGTTSVAEVDTVGLSIVTGQNLETSGPETPLPETGRSLLDLKRRKRTRSGAKKVAEPETSSTATSSKRRRKSWTSLKEIANKELGKFTKSTIPFII